MTVHRRPVDARWVWALLVGARTPEEPNVPTEIPTAELVAAWRAFGAELRAYWAHAVDWPAPGWPDPVVPGRCWAELVLEDGVDAAAARAALDEQMDWDPETTEGDTCSPEEKTCGRSR